MTTQQQPTDWRAILGTAGPYPIEAFNFVREGLSHTVERVHGEGAGHRGNRGGEAMDEMDRHVSGQQLCLGLRDYAIHQYGLLAPVVLEQWRIQRTDDFGRIVFAMIDAGLMSKNADDTLDDFRGVFDFQEAFSHDEILAQLETT